MKQYSLRSKVFYGGFSLSLIVSRLLLERALSKGIANIFQTTEGTTLWNTQTTHTLLSCQHPPCVSLNQLKALFADLYESECFVLFLSWEIGLLSIVVIIFLCHFHRIIVVSKQMAWESLACQKWSECKVTLMKIISYNVHLTGNSSLPFLPFLPILDFFF